MKGNKIMELLRISVIVKNLIVWKSIVSALEKEKSVEYNVNVLDVKT